MLIIVYTHIEIYFQLVLRLSCYKISNLDCTLNIQYDITGCVIWISNLNKEGYKNSTKDVILSF